MLHVFVLGEWQPLEVRPRDYDGGGGDSAKQLAPPLGWGELGTRLPLSSCGVWCTLQEASAPLGGAPPSSPGACHLQDDMARKDGGDGVHPGDAAWPDLPP